MCVLGGLVTGTDFYIFSVQVCLDTREWVCNAKWKQNWWQSYWILLISKLRIQYTNTIVLILREYIYYCRLLLNRIDNWYYKYLVNIMVAFKLLERRDSLEIPKFLSYHQIRANLFTDGKPVHVVSSIIRSYRDARAHVVDIVLIFSRNRVLVILTAANWLQRNCESYWRHPDVFADSWIQSGQGVRWPNKRK